MDIHYGYQHIMKSLICRNIFAIRLAAQEVRDHCSL